MVDTKKYPKNIPIHEEVDNRIPMLISVVVDGECLHSGELDAERVDFGHADTVQADWVENWLNCYVCYKCKTAVGLVEEG